MTSLATSKAPSLYLSGMQWARNYAIAYLDEECRQLEKQEATKDIYDKPVCFSDYSQYLEKILTFAKTADKEWFSLFEEALKNLINKHPDRLAISNLNDHIKSLEKSAWHLNPKQSFKDALELNILWGARNSIIYSIAMNLFFIKESINSAKDILTGITNLTKENEEGLLDAIYNLCFIKPLHADPIPSSVDGYTIEKLKSITNDGNDDTGITLPASASSC